MVRILAISDEEVATMRSRVRDLEVDLVVAAGDLPWDYVESVVAALGAPAAYVPGNHDPRIGRDTAPGPRGTINVDGRIETIAGLRIAGLGGCVRYNAGHHQYTQEQYDRRARDLLKAGSAPVDVLLTHAPPLGLGDDTDPSHVGIAALHDVLAALEPTWHLHGHLHPYGMRKPDRQVGPTTIRNVIPWTVLDIQPRSSTSTRAGAGRSA